MKLINIKKLQRDLLIHDIKAVLLGVFLGVISTFSLVGIALAVYL